MRFPFCGLVLALTLATPAFADHFVRVHGDRITVRAENTPLKTILGEFVHAGVRVEMDPEIDSLVTGYVQDMEAAKAFEKLLKPYGYVVLWDVVPGPLGNIERLSEVRVFRREKPGRTKPFMPETDFRVTRGASGDGPEFVVDEVLISFKPGTDISAFHTLLAQIGGSVIAGSSEFGVYRIRLPQNSNVESLVESLRQNPIVANAEPNFVYRLPEGAQAKTAVPASQARQKPERIAGVPAIAVLDSGLDMISGLGDLVINSFNAVNPDQSADDTVGHGTQMALIASGAVLPGGAADGFAGVPVVAIRAFDENGVTSNFTIMRALEHASSQGARVINMSWGSNTSSDFLRNAIQLARQRGMIIVASAGNEPTGNAVFPAAYPGAVSVSALEADGRPWSGSNYGNTVRVAAPGTAEFPVGHRGPPGAYAGTSIASAYVARQISLYLSKNPAASAQSVIQHLEQSLSPLDGDDKKYGKGKLDARAVDRLFESAGP